MRTISKEELQEVLKKHKKWLLDEVGGERADLRWANLSGADFRHADLSEANLGGAYLADADFRHADLSRACLTGAFLKGVLLGGADLEEANLSGAYLRGTHFGGAFLKKTDLARADIIGTDLGGAYLRGANLVAADLRGASLAGAFLREATVDYPIACPESGSFIGYKKASGYIIKLKILESAKRLSSTTRKCRCDKAKVVAIENIDGTMADIDSVNSTHDISFAYKIGEVVSVDNFDDNRWNECTTGIHFFITRNEAVNYL